MKRIIGTARITLVAVLVALAAALFLLPHWFGPMAADLKGVTQLSGPLHDRVVGVLAERRP